MVGMGKIAVDEAYLRETGATGIYADGYYPHNIHFPRLGRLLGKMGEWRKIRGVG
jgi:hypothetical protein